MNSVNVINNVLEYKGWLYLFEGAQKQFSYLTGALKVNSTVIKNFVSNIKNRSLFLKEAEIPYCHVVFPSKPVVNRKALEPLVHGVESLFVNNLSCFDIQKETFYPLALLENSENVYLKTDTHMSDFGSWLILVEMLNKVGIDVSNMKPDFVDSKCVGDLTLMLGDKDFIKVKSFKSLNDTHPIGTRFDNFSALNGNTGRIVIYRNPISFTDKRVLIFGDSFFAYMLPMLSTIFKDVLFFRTPDFDPQIVDQFSPDVVLTGNAERYLVSTPKDSNGSMFLKYLNGQFYENSISSEFFEALLANCSFGIDNDLYRDWISRVDPDFIRDYAISLEPNYVEANKYMKMALEIRKNGSWIKKKIEEYENAIK